MIDFTIELAGKRIAIRAMYDEVYELCRDYLTDGPADFSVATDMDDLRYEWEKYVRESKEEGLPVFRYSLSYLETLAVYRKIAIQMLNYDTFLFHGSVIAVDGWGYLFTALSGTGKSTHTGYWRQVFGDRAVMVNDDKPLLRITEDGVLAYGTPWDGKHRLSTNTAVPLRGLCILNRADDNYIEPISSIQAFPTLLQQCYRPGDPQQLAKVLQLLDRLSKQTGLYNLGCNMSPEAAIVAYNGMNGKENNV